MGDFWVEFPLRAAEVACADERIPEPAIAPLLERLTDKSLVGRVERGGRTWYRLLETIRYFAFTKLVSDPVNIHQSGFLMHLAARTDRNLLGSVDEMWSTLLDGDTDVARQTLTVAANSFREEEGGELAGAIAALVSRTRRIGFVAGMKPSSDAATADRLDSVAATQGIMRRFRDGFRTGAHRRDPQIQIIETFLTGEPDFALAFQNPVGAGKKAAALFADDVDVVFHAAGGSSGHRIFEMARRVTEDTGMQRWVIGVDFDEYRDLEEHLRPHVLASVRKQVPMAVYRQIKHAVAEGRAEAAPWFDLANGGLTLATSGGHIDHLAADLAAIHADVVARAASSR